MKKFKENFSFSYYLSCWENSWISLYEFFNNEVLKLENKEFNTYKKVVDLNIFNSIQLENFCIVSKNAIEFNRNSNFQLHSLNKPAIIFPGSEYQFKLWYVQGVNISEELFNKLHNKEYTFEQWSKESNEEIKSLVLAFYEEKFGGQFVFDFLSKYLKEIDTFVNKKEEKYLENTNPGMNVGVYTLFKGRVNNIDIAYVRCYDYSSDRLFFLGVHPDFINAKDAIASLCQCPTELLPHLKEIRRCGEVYAFTFNEIGKNIIKENKVDVNNVSSLKGDDYFKLITWEY